MNRKDFIKKTTLATLGFSISASAKSYRKILGANDRINIAVAGVNSRGRAHLSMANTLKNQINVMALADPDSRVFAKCFKDFPEILGNDTLKVADFRRLLDNKDLDALTIATPDHWHAPMALLALNAGKHVYLEKPCCHNPAEGYMLIDAVKKYGKKVQIGNQQRSAPTTINLKKALDDGIIGDVYYAKAWYEANRGSIGTGKEIAPPSELDWDLWQGPAPRKKYKDNWVHYNWHWFWHWGTGEIVNNGLHEMDVARWLLNVSLPSKVSSAGGRFSFKDDWEFYDTQNASFEFPEGKMLSWEGKSCNGMDVYQRPGGRGTWLHGTQGTAVVDRGGYIIYDKTNKVIKTENERNSRSSVDTLGITGLDNYHMQNFVDAIKKDEKLNSPIEEAVKSTLLCHLGNMSQKFGKTLSIDTTNGKPKDAEAMTLWSRSYEKGWEPKV